MSTFPNSGAHRTVRIWTARPWRRKWTNSPMTHHAGPGPEIHQLSWTWKECIYIYIEIYTVTICNKRSSIKGCPKVWWCLYFNPQRTHQPQRPQRTSVTEESFKTCWPKRPPDSRGLLQLDLCETWRIIELLEILKWSLQQVIPRFFNKQPEDLLKRSWSNLTW